MTDIRCRLGLHDWEFHAPKDLLNPELGSDSASHDFATRDCLKCGKHQFSPYRALRPYDEWITCRPEASIKECEAIARRHFS